MAANQQINEGEFQHQLILKEAIKQNIHIEDLSKQYGTIASSLSKSGKSVTIVQGIVQDWIHEQSAQLCDDKYETKKIFNLLTIPTPKYFSFEQINQIKPAYLTGIQYVCKPGIGTNGIGVTTGIRSLKDIEQYFNTHAALCRTHLLEEFVEGYDVRIQVIAGKLVAACMRLPAYVIGNGYSSLHELVATRRKEIKMQNPANDLFIDDQSKQLLTEQKVTLKSVIPLHKKIGLKHISNMAQGGHAIDITEEVDPTYHQWVENLSVTLNMGYFALDLMSTNHKQFEQGNTFALEINARAEWLHHTFSERRTHDLAKLILNELFIRK